MFLFSKSFNLNVYKDFYRKINNNNYQKVCNKKGEILNLSFLNVKFKKKPKTKIKQLFILELISLNKSFYTFQLKFFWSIIQCIGLAYLCNFMPSFCFLFYVFKDSISFKNF